MDATNHNPKSVEFIRAAVHIRNMANRYVMKGGVLKKEDIDLTAAVVAFDKAFDAAKAEKKGGSS